MANIDEDRFKDMVELRTLFTDPSKQGQGFGTALVKLVTDQVRLCILIVDV